jgi:hypothetical protein
MVKDIPIEFWDIKIEDLYERFNNTCKNFYITANEKILTVYKTLLTVQLNNSKPND